MRLKDANSFDELFEKVITTRKPIFIEDDGKTAALITIEEWSSIRDKLSQRAPSDL